MRYLDESLLLFLMWIWCFIILKNTLFFGQVILALGIHELNFKRFYYSFCSALKLNSWTICVFIFDISLIFVLFYFVPVTSALGSWIWCAMDILTVPTCYQLSQVPFLLWITWSSKFKGNTFSCSSMCRASARFCVCVCKFQSNFGSTFHET